MKLNLWLYLSLLVGMTNGAAAINVPSPRIVQPVSSGSNTAPYQVGDVVHNFKLKNVDGNLVSLTDYASSKGVIIVFTSNHCPFAKTYEDRIIALQGKYSSQGFPVIAINPSDPATHQDDSLEKMKERASSKGYNYPYLIDDMQLTAKAFGASRTPQVYILQKSGATFTVKYIGMIDDNPQDPAAATKFYVDEAVTNLIGGKPVVTTTTKPIGCAIKWKNP